MSAVIDDTLVNLLDMAVRLSRSGEQLAESDPDHDRALIRALREIRQTAGPAIEQYNRDRRGAPGRRLIARRA